MSFVELSAKAGDSEAAAALARFPEIEVLALVGPAFDDRTCQTLAKLDGLEHLGLAETRIGPAGIERLASLYRLRSLGIRGSEGTESEGIFPALPGLAELQELYLEKTPLSRSDVAVIAALPNLRTLVITEPQQQGENVFADLGSAKDLRTLVLETQPLPEEERDLIAQELTKLRRLECLRISLSDDESLEGLPALPDLRSLDVKGDFNLKTADFDLRGSISDAALCEWSPKAPNCIVRYEIPSSQPRWFRAGERVDDESVWQDFWKRWTSSSETSP